MRVNGRRFISNPFRNISQVKMLEIESGTCWFAFKFSDHLLFKIRISNTGLCNRAKFVLETLILHYFQCVNLFIFSVTFHK